ncbi:MAG: hypothetical protein AB7E73_12135 [Burkholderiales bacterium]
MQVDWITQLLKDAPAAAPYRAQLETLAREHAELKAENARLKDELAWFIPQWDTLDGDAVRTLEHLSRVERAQPPEIAAVNKVNIQIVESYLVYLAKGEFVHPPLNGEPHFRISAKGRRYLNDRGLPKA